MTLEDHLATQQALLTSDVARGMAVIVGRIGSVASVISQELAHAALRDQLGYAGGSNLSGDQVKKLDVWGHDIMTAALRKSGMCAALVSEEAPEPIEMYEGKGPTGLVVACDPVDGSSNLDVNGTVGTIFSLRPSRGLDPAGPAALGPGTEQVAAGYVMYGPATTLVYTAGHGTHGFTMDHASGEFFLTHPNIRIPKKGKVYGINEGNVSTWHPGQRAFVEYLRTSDKATGRPYSLRYSGAMVAENIKVWRSFGSRLTMRSTSGMKPMSSIRSDSSMTRILTSFIRILPRSYRSIRRPGVAIKTSTPRSSFFSWSTKLSPPISSAKSRLQYLPYFSKLSAT